MFAKNKVSQSMLDAVNSVLEEGKIDEASLKIPTATGTKVLGRGYGNSAKAHEVQHKNPFEKGPSKSDLKGIKAPTKKELKSIGESEGSEEDKEEDAKGERETGMTHAQYEKSERDKKEDKKKSMKKESAFTSKLLSVFRENKASGAQETFTDNNMGENKALVGKQKKLDKNHNGKLDAQDFKMLRKEDISEEQLDEMINEVLSKDASAGDWIHDFVHSKNPKFAGKSKAERKRMALGAYYGAQKEEVEQINEISKSEVEHHFNNWINSEHAPDHHDAGDDNKIHQSALGYLKHTKEPKEKHEKIAMHIADKFHGSGIWEEVEQAEALVENFEIINEVSVGAKIRAYANHARDAWEHGDMGNDDESEHHSNRAEKIMAHIEKHHGPEAAKHADKLANSMTFGRHNIGSKTSPGKDSLSGGLRRSSDTPSLTKSGKIPKGTQKSMRNPMWKRKITGPKGHLPEEVDLEEGDAQYKKNPPRTKMSDVVDRKKTVKDLVNRIRNPQYFGSGKVKGLDEVQEAVETTQDKNAGKISTDTLAGRIAGGKLNSFRNFKTNLTTSGEDSIPSEIEHGEDTKEKQKISTTPGPVDVKLDDKLTGSTPYTHFQKKEKITTEEVRGVLKKIRGKEAKEHGKEIDDFNKKVANNEEVEPINEDAWLDKYLLSKGINPKFISQATKISHAKSGAFMTWKQSHQTESVSVPFDNPYKNTSPVTTDKSGAKHTPMSRAKDLAKSALKKIKQDTGNEKG